MSDVVGENVVFQIEVEDQNHRIGLIFDRKASSCVLPWQDAFRLAELMLQIAAEVKGSWPHVSIITANEEARQIRLAHQKGLVAFFTEWTDRIWFTSIQAFECTAMAIRRTAQDCQYAERGVNLAQLRTGNG
jgi:hypothetical protein